MAVQVSPAAHYLRRVVHGPSETSFPLDEFWSYRDPSQSSTTATEFNNQVLVREIAFGPDCDPTVRGVSLWFDIADKDVTVCTPQQAKRYRWKKGVKSNRENASSPSPSKPKTSAFDSKDCFVMIRASEKEAYDLSTEILAHHLGMLRAERIANLRSRSAALGALQIESESLKTTFDNLKHHWQMWAWPINQGRSQVDEQTPVPPVDGEYGPCPTGRSW